MAPADLGRQVVAVRVKVGRDVPVRRARLHGQEPGLHVPPLGLPPDREPLVVWEGCCHPLQKGREHAVDHRELRAQEERPAGLAQLVVDRVHQRDEVEPLCALVGRRGEPSEPAREELPLERQQRPHTRVGWIALVRQERAVRRAGEGALDRHQDLIGLRNHLAINAGDWDAPGRVELPEPVGLVAVAVHVDLLDCVGHALLLERQPSLFTVRTPSRRVSVEHDPLCICLCAVKHADSRQMAGLVARARSEPLTEAPLIVGRLLFPQAVQLLPRRGGVTR
mmetsp:Transcript_7881/g.25808  ORF Transcript_7881/g.25808 Transcript_7881/m.25808 type:complete len:280 (-) Transcript_7881:211-1050(-)